MARPCAAACRRFVELALEHASEEVVFAALDIASCPRATEAHGVIATPTLLVFDGGKVVDEFSGDSAVARELQRIHGGQRLAARDVAAPFVAETLQPVYSELPRAVGREILEEVLPGGPDGGPDSQSMEGGGGGDDSVPRLVMRDVMALLLRRIDPTTRLTLASARWPK